MSIGMRAWAGLVVLCAASAATADDMAPSEAAAVACSVDQKGPKLIATSAAAVPDALWDHQAKWDAAVRFRLRPSGVPYAVKARVEGATTDSDVEESATVAALQRYRFCIPQEFSTDTDWLARMRFTYTRLGEKQGRTEMYVQLFVPSYTRADAAARRAGKVVVRGFFEADGRPSRVEVAESSGDPALDAKTLDAMGAYQMVYRDPAQLRFPLVFATPYTYEMR